MIVCTNPSAQMMIAGFALRFSFGPEMDSPHSRWTGFSGCLSAAAVVAGQGPDDNASLWCVFLLFTAFSIGKIALRFILFRLPAALKARMCASVISPRLERASHVAILSRISSYKQPAAAVKT